MPKNVKRQVAPGRSITLKKSTDSSCEWCLEGTRPANGLCYSCVIKFKRLLTSTKWSALRRSLLAEKPFCELCLKIGTRHEANQIHHIQEWRFYPDLFWDESNLQCINASCHSKITSIQMRNLKQ